MLSVLHSVSMFRHFEKRTNSHHSSFALVLKWDSSLQCFSVQENKEKKRRMPRLSQRPPPIPPDFTTHFPTHPFPLDKRKNLVVSVTALGELETDSTARKSSVDLSVGVQPMVNTTTLLLIQNDLQQLAAILLCAGALADDLNRVDDIREDGVVDGSESAGARTLLGLGCARAGGALGAGQDAAGGDDQDMTVGELLLKLTGETVDVKKLVSWSTAEGR